MKIVAYAESLTKGKEDAKKTSGFIRSWLVTGVLMWCLSPVSQSATLQDLKREISALTAQVERERDQGIEVINAITVAIAPPLSVTVGTVGGVRGTTVNVPVYFKASTSPVSSFQFDVVASTEISVTSAVAGIAALASGKSVQMNPVSGAKRVIVFGLNQAIIPSGPVVILRVDIPANATSGKKDIVIRSISGASPSGTTVVLTGKNDPVIVK